MLPQGSPVSFQVVRSRAGLLSTHCRGIRPQLALVGGGESCGVSQVVMGTSENLSCCHRKSGLLSRCKGQLRIPPESLHGNRASSQAEAGYWGFLSSCDRGLGVPIEFHQGSQALYRVEVRTPLSSWVAKGFSSLLLSSDGEFWLFLEVQVGSQTSLHIVRGYSGFHLSQCRESVLLSSWGGAWCPFNLWQDPWGFSRVSIGETGLLYICEGKFKFLWVEAGKSSLILRWDGENGKCIHWSMHLSIYPVNKDSESAYSRWWIHWINYLGSFVRIRLSSWSHPRVDLSQIPTRWKATTYSKHLM